MANLHPFIEGILHYLKGQKAEVNLGDTKVVLKFSDYDISVKNIIVATVKDGFGDCLVLEVEKEGIKTDVYINVWSIKTIVPWSSPLFTRDIFENEESGLDQNGRKKR
jgi:hypothetical protein